MKQEEAGGLTSDTGAETHHLGRGEDVGPQPVRAAGGQQRRVDVLLHGPLLLLPLRQQLVRLCGRARGVTLWVLDVQWARTSPYEQ